jgi:hypothetical protein
VIDADAEAAPRLVVVLVDVALGARRAVVPALGLDHARIVVRTGVRFAVLRRAPLLLVEPRC